MNAQFLQWEKAHQQGYNHSLVSTLNGPDGKVWVLSKVQRSQSLVSHSEILSIDWDGTMSFDDEGFSEALYINPYNSTGSVMGIGANRILCDWCGVGYHQYWCLFSYDAMNVLPYNRVCPDINHWDWPIGSFGFDRVLTEPTGFFVASNGDLFSAGTTELVRYSEGLSPTEFNPLYFDTLDIELLLLAQGIEENQGIALTANQAGILDTSGMFTPAIDFSFTIDSVKHFQEENTFVLFSESTLRIMNNQFQLIDSVQIDVYFDSLKHAIYKSGKFFILGALSGEISVKTIQNNILINTFLPDTTDVDFRMLAVAPDEQKFMLIGYESTHVPNNHLVIQVYGNEDVNYLKTQHNLAITAVNEAPVETLPCPSAWSPFQPNIKYYSAYVQVSNTGSETINSFYINATWDSVSFYPFNVCPELMDCRKNVLSNHVVDQPINPDESVWVFVTFHEGPRDFISQPVCYWVSTPNDQPDRNPADDQWCEIIYLGVDDNLKQDNWQVYPNPATNNITIETSKFKLNSDVIIMDMQGRVIWKNRLSNSSETFALPNIATGIYQIQLNTNNEFTQMKRLLIVNP